MPSFTIVASPAAARQFKGLPSHARDRFLAAFPLLEDDPHTPRPGLHIEKMTDRQTWRLRIGRFRGIFRIDGREVVFLRFAHRGEVYR